MNGCVSCSGRVPFLSSDLQEPGARDQPAEQHCGCQAQCCGGHLERKPHQGGQVKGVCVYVLRENKHGSCFMTCKTGSLQDNANSQDFLLVSRTQQTRLDGQRPRHCRGPSRRPIRKPFRRLCCLCSTGAVSQCSNRSTTASNRGPKSVRSSTVIPSSVHFKRHLAFSGIPNRHRSWTLIFLLIFTAVAILME